MFIDRQCSSCGAKLKVDENGVVKCIYCNTIYLNPNQQNFTPPPPPPPPRRRIIVPPRPTINTAIAIVLLIFYLVPGIIYLIHIQNKQKEWDNRYSNLEID